jgi:hypothetical protein
VSENGLAAPDRRDGIAEYSSTIHVQSTICT